MAFVDGNYRVEIYIATFIRHNQEQLRKMQLYRSLAGIEPAALRFQCSAPTNSPVVDSPTGGKFVCACATICAV